MNIKNKIILAIMLQVTVIALIVGSCKKQTACQMNIDMVSKIMSAQGVEPEKYIPGIDCHKSVTVYNIKKGDAFIQYQVSGNPQGNFYGFPDSSPSELGISDVGYDYVLKKVVKKSKKTYIASRDFNAMLSYAAPITDDWSTPEIETQTEGTAPQIFTTCKTCFE